MSQQTHKLFCFLGNIKIASQHTNHCHAVVEQRLSKHHDEEDLVDVDLLKHGDDGYRVHSSNQTAEEKILKQTDVKVTCSTQGRKYTKSGFI